jgi:membrane protein required for colicin V production
MQSLDAYNIVDLSFAAVVIVLLILGAWKGFLRTLTALAGVVLGAALAFRYYPSVQPYLSKISSLDPSISMILSMAVIFVGVQIVFTIVRIIIDALLKVTRLSWLDRSLGAAMGFAAGFVIIAGAAQVLLVGVPDWPPVKTSKLIGPVERIAIRAVSYAPQSAKDQMQQLTTKLKGITDTVPASGRTPAASLSKPPAPSVTDR